MTKGRIIPVIVSIMICPLLASIFTAAPANGQYFGGTVNISIVSCSGTYARNPVSLAAADATMDAMLGSAHSRIGKFGGALVKGLQDILADKNLDAIVQGYPSMFQVLFTQQEQVRTYREFSKCDQDKFGKFQHRLLQKGIMLDENNSEPFYTSAAHDNNDLEKTLEAIEASFQSIR